MDVTRTISAIQEYWGFDELRPLQAEAIRAGVEQRDSLVVMPTGGGKSLCYQVPPVVADRTDVVVSPLISLMKDQVDGLRASGYPAAALNSAISNDEQRDVIRDLQSGDLRLLFVSPERLLMPGFLALVHKTNIRAFAIDEAHCISHWGHDFRPEYRRLRELKEIFDGISLHAFTATATPRVQRDIVEQLGLENPNVLVGGADRPNLTYRILPRVDVQGQTLEVVRRHAGEAVIVYCITRKETETLASVLGANGVRAAAYHAGMDAKKRRRTQEAFSIENLDVVVATVAFGMGIDRSNVRCVIHTGMPKSMEHYQQETGRAGRDGLPAECVLLYSAADVLRWQGLVQRNEVEDGDAAAAAAQLELLRHMQGLCSTLECRHRALSRYFGQPYEPESCGACDVCLDEVEPMPESTTVARKILSCVARLEQRFGVGQVVQVLRGADTDTVRKWGHEHVSTYGLLRELPEKTVTNLVYQLVDQNLLERPGGDRPILQLNEQSVEVLRGEREVRLVEPKVGAVRRSQAEVESMEGVDAGLFERLRELRRELARERGVPPYVIFDDRTLRDIARVRPTSPETMRSVRGVGEKKLVDPGPAFLDAVRAHCAEHDLATDVNVVARPAPVASGSRPRSNPARDEAMRLFAGGASLADVTAATGRTLRTVAGYLVDYVQAVRPEGVEEWVPEIEYDRVAKVAADLGTDRLKPLFRALDGEVSYETISVVLAHQATLAPDGEPSENLA
ncbi:MAG: DNA helicase RecQ [Planctomycetes bacterium]|nr:DNA helicase RecQ [Planctomycetota bacterium]